MPLSVWPSSSKRGNIWIHITIAGNEIHWFFGSWARPFKHLSTPILTITASFFWKRSRRPIQIDTDLQISDLCVQNYYPLVLVRGGQLYGYDRRKPRRGRWDVQRLSRERCACYLHVAGARIEGTRGTLLACRRTERFWISQSVLIGRGYVYWFKIYQAFHVVSCNFHYP